MLLQEATEIKGSQGVSQGTRRSRRLFPAGGLTGSSVSNFREAPVEALDQRRRFCR